MSTNRLIAYRSTLQRVRRGLAHALPLVRPYGYNLSISHSHRLVWFRVAKVGTRTVLHELEKGGVRLDERHPRLLRYPNASTSNYLHAAFVRNPWDRLASAWQNKIVDANRLELDDRLLHELRSFDAFVRYLESIDVNRSDIHVRPQSRLIDRSALDFMGRFESFAVDVERLLDTLGVAHEGVARMNISRRTQPYRDLYDERSRAIVERLYAEDIEAFGYGF